VCPITWRYALRRWIPCLRLALINIVAQMEKE
jgi:hypothetical protein